MSQGVAPNFFIVGAAKCGTTSLYKYLEQHPDVFVSKEKEPHYFGSDLDVKPNRRVRDLQVYLDLFHGSANIAARGEASSKYLYSERAAEEIKAFAPDARIIIMLRNPIDMMWSMHGQNLYAAEEDILSFEEALDAQTDRREGRRIPAGTHGPNELQYEAMATFSPQVQRFFDTFDRTNVMVILFDDFAAETADVVHEVFQFLGVDDSFTPEIEVHNKGSWVRNPGVKRFLKNHPSIARFVGRSLSPQLRSRIGSILYAAKGGGPKRPAGMDPELRRRLCATFRPEVQRLGALLDRNLDHWVDPNAA